MMLTWATGPADRTPTRLILDTSHMAVPTVPTLAEVTASLRADIARNARQ